MSLRREELVSIAQMELTYASPSVSNQPAWGVPQSSLPVPPESSVKLVAKQTSPTRRKGTDTNEARRAERGQTPSARMRETMNEVGPGYTAKGKKQTRDDR